MTNFALCCSNDSEHAAGLDDGDIDIDDGDIDSAPVDPAQQLPTNMQSAEHDDAQSSPDVLISSPNIANSPYMKEMPGAAAMEDDAIESRGPENGSDIETSDLSAAEKHGATGGSDAESDPGASISGPNITASERQPKAPLA